MASTCTWDDMNGNLLRGRACGAQGDRGLVLLPAKHDSEGVSVGHGVDVIEGMGDGSFKKAATV